MATTAELDKQLNDMILQGKALEGFDAFYADDVVMQENNEAPRVGKAANRQFEINFFSSVENFYGMELQASAVNGDTTFGQWFMDVQLKGMPRMAMTQVSVRKWQDGKLVHERFFYSRG